MQADAGGYWKVARIVDVLKLKPGGVMVEVEWAGAHGKEQIEEVRLIECSAALRRAAKALLPVPQVRVARPAPASSASEGSRKSPRVADSAAMRRLLLEECDGEEEREATPGGSNEEMERWRFGGRPRGGGCFA